MDNIYSLICDTYFKHATEERLLRLVAENHKYPDLEVLSFEQGSLIAKFKGSPLAQQIFANYLVQALIAGTVFITGQVTTHLEESLQDVKNKENIINNEQIYKHT